MSTITFGFFAVLIARELPGRRRVWPYLLGGVVVVAIGFARLYLGAHWLSDVVVSALLGIAWILALGIAYRSHVQRSMWMRPLAAIFYCTFALAAAWHAPRAAGPLLARFHAPAAATALATDGWWEAEDWRALPARRDERDADLRWPLDLQVAGPLPRLQQWLGAQGWRVQPQADWVATLGLLDDDRGPAAQPVLPATLDAEAEALLLRRAGASPDEIQVLRLWASPVRLADGTPLWLGSAQTLRYTRPFDLFGLWLPVDDHGRAHAALLQDLQGLPLRTGAHGEVAVLRVDLRAGAGTPD